jgi:hypothetical protein
VCTFSPQLLLDYAIQPPGSKYTVANDACISGHLHKFEAQGQALQSFKVAVLVPHQSALQLTTGIALLQLLRPLPGTPMVIRWPATGRAL